MPRGHHRQGKGPGRGRGRRWSRRMRIIEPMMLLLLAERPAHGYKIVERLTEVFGVMGFPPQTVYRALQAMEEQGWVTADWDVESGQGPPRKVHQLTAEGKAALDMWAAEVQELQEMLQKFTSRHRELREDD